MSDYRVSGMPKEVFKMFELVPFVHGNHLRTNDPFREMEDLENRFFGGTAGDWGGIRTDIQDKGDHYLMEADLPGFKKDDIHIDMNDGMMTITAERHSEHEEKDKKGNYVRCERSYGSYQRSFDLSGIDESGLQAAYADGVLKLTLPKSKEQKPETHQVKIA